MCIYKPAAGVPTTVKTPKNNNIIPKAFVKFSKPTNFTNIIERKDPCSAVGKKKRKKRKIN